MVQEDKQNSNNTEVSDFELKEQLHKSTSENNQLKTNLTKLGSAYQQALTSKQQAIQDNINLRNKLADYENEKFFLARTKRITIIAKLMQEKGLIDTSKEAIDEQIRNLASMDDTQLESWKKVVLSAPARNESTPIEETESTKAKKAFANNQAFFIPETDDTLKKHLPSTNTLEQQLSQLWDPQGLNF